MKLRKSFLLLVVLLCAGIASWQVRVHYINVGQADSILVEMKTAAILIDAGGESMAPDENRDRDHLRCGVTAL